MEKQLLLPFFFWDLEVFELIPSANKKPLSVGTASEITFNRPRLVIPTL
jgi:hypothetical protein